MKLELRHILGILGGLFVIVLDFLLFFRPLTRWFNPVLVIGVVIGALPYIIDFLTENKRQKEVEEKFLEFVRNVVGTVEAGVPIPKAIIQVSTEDYGALSQHVKKLARQIEWGIPTQQALTIFGIDTRNKVIKRSVSIVIEAEKSGGNIEDVLEAVTNSVVEIKKIKEERRASVYSQVVQGYIVFFVFIIIMLVLEVKLLPPLTNLTNVSFGAGGGGISDVGGPSGGTIGDLSGVFTSMVLIQGFFVGIMIGKFSEGDLKFGIKHSLILMITGYLILSFIRGI